MPPSPAGRGEPLRPNSVPIEGCLASTFNEITDMPGVCSPERQTFARRLDAAAGGPAFPLRNRRNRAPRRFSGTDYDSCRAGGRRLAECSWGIGTAISTEPPLRNLTVGSFPGVEDVRLQSPRSRRKRGNLTPRCFPSAVVACLQSSSRTNGENLTVRRFSGVVHRGPRFPGGRAGGKNLTVGRFPGVVRLGLSSPIPTKKPRGPVSGLTRLFDSFGHRPCRRGVLLPTRRPYGEPGAGASPLPIR